MILFWFVIQNKYTLKTCQQNIFGIELISKNIFFEKRQVDFFLHKTLFQRFATI